MRNTYLIAFIGLSITLAAMFAGSTPNSYGWLAITMTCLIFAAWFTSLIGMMIEQEKEGQSC